MIAGEVMCKCLESDPRVSIPMTQGAFKDCHLCSCKKQYGAALLDAAHSCAQAGACERCMQSESQEQLLKSGAIYR